MIKKVYIIMLLAMFVSCEAKEKTVQEEEIVPSVLDEGSKANWKISSLRYDVNILESIYDEVKRSNDDLKELHSSINDVVNEKKDIEEKFNDYHNKNLSYYQSANETLNNLENEKLKELLTTVLTESETNYQNEIEAIKNELENINSETNDLNDHINVLKVIKTIHFIETYQEKEKSDISLMITIKNNMTELKEKISKMLQ